MAFENELNQIQEFIENFNPEDFSSSSSIDVYVEPSSKKMNFVKKFKARTQRKKQMEETFIKAMESGELENSEVQITQDQIDALLASH